MDQQPGKIQVWRTADGWYVAHYGETYEEAVKNSMSRKALGRSGSRKDLLEYLTYGFKEHIVEVN